MYTLNKMAIFKAKTRSQLDNGYPKQGAEQNTFVFVTVPDGLKTWEHLVVAIDETNAPDIRAKVLSASCEQIKGASAIRAFFQSNLKSKTVPQFDVQQQSNSYITELLEKVDARYAIYTSLKDGNKDFVFRSASLKDKDEDATPENLEDYLRQHFNGVDNIKDEVISSSNYKYCNKRDVVDYSATWNSPHLTDEEKRNLVADGDLDIMMNNDKRVTYHEFKKMIETKYPGRNYTIIGLHGNPASGKTKMVNGYCRLNNIPLIYIACDVDLTINRVLAQVGPVNQNSMITDKKVLKDIEALKNRLTLLLEVKDKTDDDIKMISAISATLESLAALSKQTADLVKTESTLAKCLKYNLYAICFLDEVNLLKTSELNYLGTLMSEGTFRDGPKVYHNNFTIKWVLAWNPSTSNVKAFDDKFYSRLSFLFVEDVSLEDRKAYDRRITRQAQKGIKDADLTKLKQIAEGEKTLHPEGSAELDYAMDIICNCDNSYEAREWYLGKVIDKIEKNEVTKCDEFDPQFADQVTFDSDDECDTAIDNMKDFIQSVNSELCNLTKGKDVRNPNRNAYYYISPRSEHFLFDDIMSYKDVRKATMRMIMNIVPGGFTIAGYQNKDAANDEAPTIITNTIVEKLRQTINTLQTKLFTSLSKADAQSMRDLSQYGVYDASLWTNPTVNPKADPSTDIDDDLDDIDLEDVFTETEDNSSSSVEDELDHLI